MVKGRDLNFMNKTILGLIAAFVISGCITDPMTFIDLQKGNGSVSRSVDGDTTFRYIVHANAYKGITSSPDELRKQHEWLIGSYLGEGGYCPNGYQITEASVESSVPAYVYEGTCR